MTQGTPVATVVQVRATSFLLAALGFLLLAIGSVGASWFSAYDNLNFALQTIGGLLIALALVLEWRNHVERRGWAALIFFIIAILLFSAIWIPYAINPDTLGTASATQMGFLTSGVAAICVSIGTFLVMRRKEMHLEHPIHSVDPKIKATFTQLLFFGLGTLLYGVDFIWIGEEESNHAQFSLIVIALVLILIAVISFESHLTVQLGRPAVLLTILAVLLYIVDFVLHALPTWMDEEWRLSLGIQGVSYALGAVACLLAASHKSKAKEVGVASR